MASSQQNKDYIVASSHKRNKWKNQLQSATAVTAARTQDEVTRSTFFQLCLFVSPCGSSSSLASRREASQSAESLATGRNYLYHHSSKATSSYNIVRCYSGFHVRSPVICRCLKPETNAPTETSCHNGLEQSVEPLHQMEDLSCVIEDFEANRYKAPDGALDLYCFTKEVPTWDLLKFLFRFTGNDEEINLLGDGTEKPEFAEWSWVTPQQVIELAVDFKKPVYEEVLKVFAPHLQLGSAGSL
ncbi:hypothetical protein IFM89_018887 [Coptis chinensis]|uniref:Nudix hydrolase domain-containing protein n=1 Tax=Coptis chinensis TaxID=261450 RepID=A0A835HE00_9MAGN|nr:hypothetical protein IFM89_018887 [Coptis chinensis]